MPEQVDISTLDGEALNRGIAGMLGWKQCSSYRPMCAGWYQDPHIRHSEHDRQKEPPDFISTVDRLAEPERILLDAGWGFDVSCGSKRDKQHWVVVWADAESDGDGDGAADTEALARARAVYAGLLALNGGATLDGEARPSLERRADGDAAGRTQVDAGGGDRGVP